MAEGIMADKFRKAGIEAVVDSCGFESFHAGDPPDYRAIEAASRRGIDISGHRARLFTKMDFSRFSHIYVMDQSHHRSVMRLAISDDDHRKTDYLLNILYPGENRGVTDPWYHDADAFEEVFELLDQACEGLLKKFSHGKKSL